MEKETLHKFFAGTASEAEKAAIKAWMEEDESHRQAAADERAFYDALSLADDRPFREERLRPRLSLRSLTLRYAGWAAMLLLAFLSGHVLSGLDNPQAAAGENIVRVPSGQRVNLLLADGTKVCLNAGSTFSYPSSFAGGTRNVKLDGEGYFEVSADREKPFIVQTHACDVKVTGTRFNVDAYEKEGNFSAALMEGKIEVTSKDNPGNAVRLAPDHEVRLQEGKLRVSGISDYDVYRWREGLICFKDLSFTRLMKRIEKYYEVRIVVENPALAAHSFSGKFRIADGIDHLLRILQKETGYTYTHSEDGRVICIR